MLLPCRCPSGRMLRSHKKNIPRPVNVGPALPCKGIGPNYAELERPERRRHHVEFLAAAPVRPPFVAHSTVLRGPLAKTYPSSASFSSVPSLSRTARRPHRDGGGLR